MREFVIVALAFGLLASPMANADVPPPPETRYQSFLKIVEDAGYRCEKVVSFYVVSSWNVPRAMHKPGADAITGIDPVYVAECVNGKKYWVAPEHPAGTTPLNVMPYIWWWRVS
jgi:hypothetical protein